MTNIVYDALLSYLPQRRKTASNWISFNCPCCVHLGHSRDTRQRGGIKLSGDQVGYNCFNCKMAAVWKPGQFLSKRMADLLGWMGMSDEDVTKLRFDVSRLKYRADNGMVEIKKHPLPAGARPIGEWMDELHTDENFAAVLEDIADMPTHRIRAYYWTPDAGPSGDMNRRIIEAVGPSDDPVGWIAASIDDGDLLWSDVSVFYYGEEEE